jgi:hypothetical protein
MGGRIDAHRVLVGNPTEGDHLKNPGVDGRTWSPIFREGRRLRVFENRVLRRIFGSKRDEVTRKWRRLRYEKRYVLYSSPNIIRIIELRRMRWAEYVACIGARRVHKGF